MSRWQGPLMMALLMARPAGAGEWEPGDVAIGIDGTYQIRSPEGVLKDVLSDGSYGEATGCVFADDGTHGTMPCP